MDQTLLEFFNQSLAHPWLDVVMIGLTTWVAAALPLSGFALLLSPARRRFGFTLLSATLGAVLLALMFQYLAMRPRPEMVRLIIAQPNFPSFPSGHAAGAFGWAVVILMAERQRWWGWAGLLLAGLIALSRLYLGHHFPSDIFAGAVLGVALGIVSYGLIIRRGGWGWLLWLQVALALLISLMAYLGVLPYWLIRWPFADKVMHFLLIGSVAFWLNLWLRGRTFQLLTWAIPLAIAIPFSLALVEETLQFFSPIRSADLSDMLSNTLGLLFFWWLSRKVLVMSDQNTSPTHPTGFAG